MATVTDTELIDDHEDNSKTRILRKNYLKKTIIVKSNFATNIIESESEHEGLEENEIPALSIFAESNNSEVTGG